MKGCVLHRRYAFFDGDKLYPVRARAAEQKSEVFGTTLEPPAADG